MSRALQPAQRSCAAIAQAQADALRVMEERSALLDRVLLGFGPQLLGARKSRGRACSEVAEFLGYLVNGYWRPMPMVRGPLYRSLPVARLFFGVARSTQAVRVAQVVRVRLLTPGGLATTTVSTGQQWDAPNGWAPLQWIAIEGLNDYGETALAETIAERWMRKVITAYRATGKLMEKYNAEDLSLVTGGGEYPMQDGFGWTNGVLRKLLALYPNAVAPGAGASWCATSPANDNVPAAGPEAGRAPAVAR